MGRGFFAEANVGLARASVTTKENIQQEVKKQTFPLDFIGLGWRFGKRPKGIFREVGYRFNLALKYAHLYTTDHKPETKGLDNISYQSFE